jgi:putative transposase
MVTHGYEMLFGEIGKGTVRLSAAGRIVGQEWQRNYYEHIVWNDEELIAIRQYILNNPLKWEIDRENPDWMSQ